MNRNGIWRSVQAALLATSTSVSTAPAVAAVAAVATIGFGRGRLPLDGRNVERAQVGLVQAARQVGRLVDARALAGGGNLRRRRLDGAAAGMDVACVVFLCNIGIVKVGLERMVGVWLHVRFLLLPSLRLLLLLLMRPNLFLRLTHGPADGQPTGQDGAPLSSRGQGVALRAAAGTGGRGGRGRRRGGGGGCCGSGGWGGHA